MSESTKKPPIDWGRVGRNPYFAIGIVFFAVAIVFFVNESMRVLGFAFLPLGIVFMSLALSGTGEAQPDADVVDGGSSEPDDPSRPPQP